MKNIVLAVLCLVPSLAFANGYKVVTKDGGRSLTYYAGQVTYSRLDKQIKCTFKSYPKALIRKGMPTMQTVLVALKIYML